MGSLGYAQTNETIRMHFSKTNTDKKTSKLEKEEWEKKNGKSNEAVLESPLFAFLDQNDEDLSEGDKEDLAMLIDNLS